MANSSRVNIHNAIRLGLLSGAVALSLSMIGMVGLFAQRDLVADVLSLGQLLLFLAPVIMAYMAAQSVDKEQGGVRLLYGTITGALAVLPLVVLILLESAFNIRQFFLNVSPALIEILTFGQSMWVGILVLVGVFTVLGVVAAAFTLLPERFKQPLLSGVIWTLTVGLFSEILSGRLRDFFGTGIIKILFSAKALRPTSAAVIFVVIAGGSYLWQQRGGRLRDSASSLPPAQQKAMKWGKYAIGITFLLILPLLMGTYLSEVINNVGIYVLMGLGLNIVVGFAGLLDLGYVAFFAIGAYTMAVLTSESELGISGLSFWSALPFCVAVSVLAGVILGIPVLKMRGDYLAIVTLGFGEIIRIMALSDLLKPVIGGAQGMLQIPKPPIDIPLTNISFSLIKPEQLYFVILAGCILAAFVSWRLSGARLGRQWMAVREDEDVAEAMGINLVSTKLLAFAIGAAFSGLSGAIFASKLTSIFPHSFSLMISINVLCLIIVGGMGSLPGVVVGALVLVGLPELLREFAEYRLLMYGALLIAMMLARPEGFWPSPVIQRELRSDQNQFDEVAGVVPESGD
jgi:branched-chain amino acid transport system permease protein